MHSQHLNEAQCTINKINTKPSNKECMDFNFIYVQLCFNFYQNKTKKYEYICSYANGFIWLILEFASICKAAIAVFVLANALLFYFTLLYFVVNDVIDPPCSKMPLKYQAARMHLCVYIHTGTKVSSQLTYRCRTASKKILNILLLYEKFRSKSSHGAHLMLFSNDSVVKLLCMAVQHTCISLTHISTEWRWRWRCY